MSQETDWNKHIIEFENFLSKGNKPLRKIKTKEKHVFGYSHPSSPPEIFHAFGIHPFRLVGRGSMDNRLADSLVQSFICSLSKNILEQGLGKELDFMDGVVFSSNLCDSCQQVANIWEEEIKTSFFHVLTPPTKLNEESSREFYNFELKRLVSKLEEHLGKQLKLDALQKSISLYEKSRKLLRDLEFFVPHPLSFSKFWGTVLASQIMPIESFVETGTLLLKALQKDASSTENQKDANFPRIMVLGSQIDQISPLQWIEEAGASIVVNDIEFGSRMYDFRVEEDGKHPLNALTDRYFSMRPDSGNLDFSSRLDWIKDKAIKSNINGAVFFIQKFCDPYGFDFPVFRKTLEGIAPMLMLEVESPIRQEGQLKNRIQSFVEMVSPPL